jgi:hypothetical protein
MRCEQRDGGNERFDTLIAPKNCHGRQLRMQGSLRKKDEHHIEDMEGRLVGGLLVLMRRV